MGILNLDDVPPPKTAAGSADAAEPAASGVRLALRTRAR